MQIVEFRPNLLPSLTRLINQELAGVPPRCVLTEAQVEHIVQQGVSLWDLHYPDEREKHVTRTVCVLEHGEVVAAGQWMVPKPGKRAFAILWIVAEPDQPFPLRTLLHLIDKQAELTVGGTIGSARCSLGIGWFGTPTIWSHITEAMLEVGYKEAQRWVLLQGATSGYPEPPETLVKRLRFYWDMNKPALEWNLTAYQDDIKIGACDVWGVPPHLEDVPGMNEWASVEWIEVGTGCQRRSLGKRLLAEQMRFQARRGIKQLLMWTEKDNQAARKLAQRMGFSSVMELAVMEKG